MDALYLDFFNGEATRVLFGTDNYQYYVNEEAPFKYDYNYLNFLKMPTIEEFSKALMKVKKQKVSEAIKVRFPQNHYVSPEIWQYAVANDFNFGLMQLYFVEPKDFNAGKINDKVQVEEVTAATLGEYLKLYEQADIEYGQKYVEQNKVLTTVEFELEKMKYYLARIDDEVVGSLRMIDHGLYDELDALYVDKSYRHQGVATKLQKVAINNSKNGAVILMADGEDTVPEMYEAQGYRNFGFWTEIQKVGK